MRSAYSIMDKYITAHFDLFRAKERAFNLIEAHGKVVRKTIYNPQKGLQEIYFYRHLPRSIKNYYPRLKNAKHLKTKVIYEMELIRAYDTSVWYLRNELTNKNFLSLLSQLEVYFDKLPRTSVSKKRWQTSTKKLVVQKLNERWAEYSKTSTFRQMEFFFINKYDVDLRQFKKTLVADLNKKLRTFSEGSLHMNHGDLCFSNILLNPNKKIKLIDPKGALNKKDLYFTIYYDLAKLSHSINGNYDGILSGHKIRFSEQQKIFSRWLKKMGFDVSFVRLIESSLFLSLLPLHLNRPETHKEFILAALAAHKASR